MDNDADAEDDGDSVKDVELVAAVAGDSVSKQQQEQQREDFVNSMGVRFRPVSESGEHTNNQFEYQSSLCYNDVSLIATQNRCRHLCPTDCRVFGNCCAF